MATLKDIAQALDLSVMSVSKALRDAPDIGKVTKERVRREADRIGYVADHNARSLRDGRSRLVGVVVQEIDDFATSGLLRGVEEAASAHGLQTMVAGARHNEDREISALRRMFERRVEAVFLQTMVRMRHRSLLLELARRHQTPLIFLDHYPADARGFGGVSWVVVDCPRAGALSAAHLAGLGHRGIIYFSGPPMSSSTADHLSGFKRGMVQAGLEYDDEKVFLSALTVEGGRDTMVRALGEGLQFTAVVCAHHAVAVGAIEVLRAHGLDVPGDVSVIGFGDGPLAEHGPVPLSTVAKRETEIGSVAFAHWLASRDRLREGRSCDPRVLPVDLIARKSTAIARRGPHLGKE